VAALVALGACSSGGGHNAARTTEGSEDSRSTTSATTATTAGSTTSSSLARNGETLLRSTPPPLLNTGDDYAKIVDSMVFYMDWVTTHPDTSLVKNVYAENGQAWQRSFDTVKQLIDKGWADRGEPTTTDGIRVIKQFDADHVLLYAKLTVPPFDYVDATGHVVAHNTGRPPHGWSYELARNTKDGNGEWFVINRTDLGEVQA
jgi:hypothetical protein